MCGKVRHPIIPDMKFDLHCHSTASDGKLSPDAVLALAVANNVGLFALTDHDTIAGFQAVVDKKFPLQLVPGIELSTVWAGVAVHVLGLDFDPWAASIHEAVEFQRNARELRSRVIDERLAKKGMPDSLQGALRYCPDIGQVGRPHFAEYLLEQGYVRNINEAFDKWLGSGKIGDVKSGWPEMPEVIRWIRSAGGIAVLAHPFHYKLTFAKLKRLIAVFQEAGGEAVEVSGQQVAPGQKQLLLKYVQTLGLAGSGGADFHDPGWAWSEIGRIEPIPAGIVPVWNLFNHTKIDIQ